MTTSIKRKSDRRPMVYSRVEAEELKEYQRLADELYDGNLSLLVRKAVRQFREQLERDAKRETEESVAA